MLVLSRKVGDQVVIAESIRVTVLEVSGNQVRLGFIASSDISIWRGELVGHRPEVGLEQCSLNLGAKAEYPPGPGPS